MGKCKRVFATALAFLMILACAACGKNKKTLALNEKQMASKDYVYSSQEINLDAFKENVNYISMNNGYLLVYSENYMFGDGEDYESEVQPRLKEMALEEVAEEEVAEPVEENAVAEDGSEIEVSEDAEGAEDLGEAESSLECVVNLWVYDINGKAVSKAQYVSNLDGAVNSASVDKDGNIYFIYCQYGARDDGSDSLVLHAYGKDGEEIYNVPLGENVNSSDWYTAGIARVDNDKIYVVTNYGMDVFNAADGSLDYDVKNEALYECAGFYKIKDGSYVALVYGEEAEPYLNRINLQTGKIEEKIELPFSAYVYSVYEGTVHDFIMSGNGGVYTYNIGDAAPTLIMDTVASDCESEYLQRLYEIDDKNFVANWYSSLQEKDCIGKFTKVEPSEIKDKTMITLGVINLDDDVRRRVLEFNKSSNEYKISVKYYQNGEGYYDMIEKINNDVISGNMPDILIVTEDFNAQNYVSKGLITDLYTLMDNDPDINREDYLKNILEATSEGEHMYQLTPRFYLHTVAAKTEFTGERNSMTMAEMEEIISAHPEVENDFALITKQDFINYALRYNMGQFVNWETGDVKFNSDQFIRILEHANKYPEEIKWEEIGDDYWQGYDSMYLENRAMFDMAYLYDFRDYAILTQGTFGGADVSFVGFPSDNGGGTVASPYSVMMVSEKSPCKDGAWEFLKYFLSDEYQDNLTSGFPVKLSSLDKMGEKAKAVEMIEDVDGNMVENPYTYWINGAQLEMKPLTDEEVEVLYSLIKSVKEMSTNHEKIEAIINEEAASYYNGQKSAADVANVIQSRVQIYVDETR